MENITTISLYLAYTTDRLPIGLPVSMMTKHWHDQIQNTNRLRWVGPSSTSEGWTDIVLKVITRTSFPLVSNWFRTDYANGTYRKVCWGLQERFSIPGMGRGWGGRSFYKEGLSLPSSFWILLCKNVMFRPRATICGYDGKKNERKNDPEY